MLRCIFARKLRFLVIDKELTKMYDELSFRFIEFEKQS